MKDEFVPALTVKLETSIAAEPQMQIHYHQEKLVFFFFHCLKRDLSHCAAAKKERCFKNSKKHIVVLLVRMRWQARKGESHKTWLKTHKSAYILNGLYQ